MDQPKLERLLRILMMLIENTTYTIPQLAQRLETSERTIYRYIDTFRDAGFLINREGEVVERFAPSVSPSEIADDIEILL